MSNFHIGTHIKLISDNIFTTYLTYIDTYNVLIETLIMHVTYLKDLPTIYYDLIIVLSILIKNLKMRQ